MIKPFILVTGATSGIGLETVVHLCNAGYRVIGVGRTDTRCSQAIEKLRPRIKTGRFHFVTADLSTFSGAENLAATVENIVAAGRDGTLACLINNAATVSSKRIVTADGNELQFQVNHLTPFYLSLRLLPILRLSPTGRIISTTSGSHRRGRIKWDDLNLTRGYNLLRAYAQSKLAHLLAIHAYHRRLKQSTDSAGVPWLAFDPGLVQTGIGSKGTGPIARLVWEGRRRFGVPVETPAVGITKLVGDDIGAEGYEVYHSMERSSTASVRSQSIEDAERMWLKTMAMCPIDDKGKPTWTMK